MTPRQLSIFFLFILGGLAFGGAWLAPWPDLARLALFVILLNWINTTGEFLLADYAKAHAEERVAASGGALDLGLGARAAPQGRRLPPRDQPPF